MDRPVRPHHRNWPMTGLATALIVGVCLTPLAAMGTWLLVTDAELAADVARRGDLVPLAGALARSLGRVILDLLAYL